MNKKEYDEGYQAAIDAIKARLNSQNQQGQSGQSGNSNDPKLPDDLFPNQQGQSGNSGGSGQSDQQGQSGNSGGSGQSGNSRGSGEQGVVRPEDCMGPTGLDNIPNTPGGMIDKQTGDEIAKKEGFEDEGGSESAREQEWKDAAVKATSKLKGTDAGKLKSKIEGLYKTASNWRKELRAIVGHSISPEDKRQAYANKNILISQNRIARTDKDKYDNVDYIMALIDSSGSMSDEQLKLCLSEIYQVALQKKPMNIVVIQCDTQIQEIKTYHNLRELQRDFRNATVKGRGGTNFKPLWDLLKNDPKYKRIKPELVMIFTDGCASQYKRDVRTMRNLCWVILNNPGWDIQYKDRNTKVIYLDTKDIK